MMLELIHPIWNEWNSRYSEPHRHYHRASHVFDMFNTATKEGILLNSNEVLAIWLHDIVYNIEVCDASNEALSAEYAVKYINDNLPLFRRLGVSAEIVETIIMDTRDHNVSYSLPHITSRNVIDLDLRILSEFSKGVYEAYVSLIADEFVPTYGIDAFVQGRAEWIDTMLSRDSIYVSKNTPLHMERNARRNLRREYEAMNDPEKYRTEYIQP